MAVSATVWAGVLPPEKHPRRLSQAVFANGKVYWVGGRALPGASPIDMDPLHPEPGLEIGKQYFENRQGGFSIYDVATDTWSAAKYDQTGPQGLSWRGSGICSEDNCGGSGSYPGGSQTIVYDYDDDGTKEIFIHGGYPTWDAAFYFYDPDIDTWDRIYPIWDLALDGLMCQYLGVADVDERTGIAYCYGGNYWGATKNTFACCNLRTGEWTVLPKGPVEVLFTVGGVVNGKLYVIGGTQDNVAASTGIWEYDIDTETWTGKVADLLVGVSRATVAKYNGKFYVVGGKNADNLDVTDIQVFDPVTKVVTKVGDLPVAMSEHGAAIDTNTGIMYAGGGSHDNSYENTTQWFKADIDVTPLTWTAMPEDPAYFPYVDWVTGDETITGTVTLFGQPVPNVRVGMTLKPNAGADPLWTVYTDENGEYTLKSPYNKPGGGSHVYVAPWLDGFKSVDQEVNVPAGGTVTVDFALDTLINKDIAPTNVGCASRRTFADEGDNPQDAFDGNPDTVWYIDGPKMELAPCIEDYAIADLGSNVSINGVSITCNQSIYRYRVDLMQGGEPLEQACWEDPASYGATILTAHVGRGGILINEESPVTYQINFAPVSVRGVRIYFDKYRNEPWDRGIRDVKIHSTTEPGGLIIGKVLNGTAPIYNAVVQLGGIGSNKVTITDTTGFFSISTNPGTQELYADAIGYEANIHNVTVPASTPYMYDVQLTAAEETGVPNGDFESYDDPWNPFLASCWELYIDDGGVNPGMYEGTRDISEGANTTPGGTAGGYITTGNCNPEEPYWYPGWLKPTAGNLLPVDPSRVYNFYFKAKQKEGWALGFWNLIWRDAEGVEVGRVSSGWFLPDHMQWRTYYYGEFDGVYKPMIRMQPPAGAAFAEIQLGIDGWPYDNLVMVAFNWDDIVFDSILAPFTSVDKVSDVKSLEDGTRIALAGKQLTALPGNGVPSGVAYIEETDRYAGIRLDIADVTFTANVGDAITFQGVVATTSEGEKYIDVTGVSAVDSELTPIKPLAMNTRFANTSLASALYVKIFGKVTELGTNYFILDDGSGTPVKVYAPTLPGLNANVGARGVLSTDGTNAVLYMTDEEAQ